MTTFTDLVVYIIMCISIYSLLFASDITDYAFSLLNSLKTWFLMAAYTLHMILL